jgi:hypothetical protein
MAIRRVTPNGRFASGFVHRWPSGGADRSQESGVRSQESGVRSQESGVRRWNTCGFCRGGNYVAESYVAEVHFWRHNSPVRGVSLTHPAWAIGIALGGVVSPGATRAVTTVAAKRCCSMTVAIQVADARNDAPRRAPRAAEQANEIALPNEGFLIHPYSTRHGVVRQGDFGNTPEVWDEATLCYNLVT